MPTLVLTGDLDAAVPSESARAVARRFPRAQLVTVANAGHTATQSSGCARGLVVRFVDSAAPVDADCAARFNPTYGVAAFPRDAAHARTPAGDPAGGDRSRRRDRRVAGMAWAAAYDAIQRSFRMFGDHGAGLRGGSFSLDGTDTTLDLSYDRVRFTRDVAVDGTAHIDFETGKVDAVLGSTARGAGRQAANRARCSRHGPAARPRRARRAPHRDRRPDRMTRVRHSRKVTGMRWVCILLAAALAGCGGGSSSKPQRVTEGAVVYRDGLDDKRRRLVARGQAGAVPQRRL